MESIAKTRRRQPAPISFLPFLILGAVIFLLFFFWYTISSLRFAAESLDGPGFRLFPSDRSKKIGRMPRSSDEVEAAHLMGAENSGLDGLTADAVLAPEIFRAFQRTRPKQRGRSPPGFGRWTGGGGVRVGDALRALRARIDDPLLRFQISSPRAVVFTLSLLKFSITTSVALLMIPMLRLIEDDICHKHYRLPHAEKISEMKCKVDEVQTAVAWLFGWQSLLGAVVNMLVAFPYGILSDR